MHLERHLHDSICRDESLHDDHAVTDNDSSTTSGAGLLADVNLNNLLSATLGADFKNGVTVSEFTPASSGAPPVGAEMWSGM